MPIESTTKVAIPNHMLKLLSFILWHPLYTRVLVSQQWKSVDIAVEIVDVTGKSMQKLRIVFFHSNFYVVSLIYPSHSKSTAIPTDDILFLSSINISHCYFYGPSLSLVLPPLTAATMILPSNQSADDDRDQCMYSYLQCIIAATQMANGRCTRTWQRNQLQCTATTATA